MAPVIKRIIMVAAGLAVIGGIGAYATNEVGKSIEQNGLRQLTHANELVSAAFDEGDLKGLTLTEADSQSEAYLKLRAKMIKVESSLKATYPVRGSYLMGIVGEEIRFIVDAADANDIFHSEPGVPYEQPPSELVKTIEDGHSRTAGPYTDEFGTYYSSFAALRDEAGQVIAYVGTDIEKSVFEQTISKGKTTSALMTACVALAYLVVLGAVERWRSRREQKRLREAELRRQAEEREKMLMNIGEGVVAFDRTGRVIFANRFALDAVCQNDRECAQGDYWKNWLLVDEHGVPLSESVPGAEAAVETAPAKTKAPKPHLKRRSGELFPVAYSVAEVDLGLDKPVTVMTFRDNTREAEIDRMKSDFIDVAVHQLKTPLTALRWSVEVLSGLTTESKYSPDEEQTIKDIVTVTQRLNTLVTSLLNIARVESGRLTVDPKPTNIGNVVTDVVNENADAAKARQQEVTIALEAGLPEISVDANLVREALKNLMTNAVKYSPAGSKIEVKLEAKGKEAILSVKDNGIGIPADEQKRLTNKFFRASNAVSSHEDGTGLGLYFVKQIVEVSGGRFWFVSTEGKGSTFSFSLPLAGSEAKQGQVKLS